MEYIDVIDEKTGQPTGDVQSKTDIHKKGYWHRTIHVWFLNSRRQLLLQHRSASLKNYPGLWCGSANGHIDQGEDAETAALREIKEELGIDLQRDKLKKLFELVSQSVLNNGTYFDNEYNNVYLVRIDLDVKKINFSDEVQDLRWI